MIDRRIRVLRAVYRLGTVTAAADALGYTPSAVSHQLRTLSKELGVRLLEPSGRGVQLTLSARILLAGADDLTSRWEAIRAELTVAGREAGGTLTLCGFSTAAAALLPAAASAVRETHPYTDVRILEAVPDECFDLLITENADVAVVIATETTPAVTDRRFDMEPLLNDPLDILVQADHPLATRTSVGLEEAAGESWILDRYGRPLHNLVVTACTYAGFTPRVAHEVVEWDTGAALVAQGFGVSLVPQLARLPADDRIRRVPLTGVPRPSRHILTAIRKGSAAQPAIATALDGLQREALVRGGH